MNWTPHDIEQAWNLSGLVLTNGRATAVSSGDLDAINERLSRARAAGTLNVPRLPTITPRQLRLWLHRNGKLAAVETALNSLQEPMKTEALIEWSHAREFDRDNPLVLQVGLVLGLDTDEMDAAWRAAAQIL